MPSSSSCSLSCLRRAIGPSVGFLSLAFLGRFGLGGCGLRSATVFLSALFGLLFRAPLAAFGDLLALALEPLEEGALLHRVAHLGHNDFRHLTSPPRTEPDGPRW